MTVVNFIGQALILLAVGVVLVVTGLRKNQYVSASMGGFFLGLSVLVFAFQLLYLSQFGERNPGLVYHGTASTEMSLGAGLVFGLTLIVVSIVGLARHRPFWRILT